MLDALKRGDQVLTQGGLYGTVQAIKGKVVELKISDDVKVQINRGYIAQVVQGDPAAVEPEVVANGAKPVNMHRAYWKSLVILAAVLLAAWTLFPSFSFYRQARSPAGRNAAATQSPGQQNPQPRPRSAGRQPPVA
jgi:hypothetical protein